MGGYTFVMDKKAQKREGKAPRRPPPPPLRPATPPSSDNEITDDDVRGLIAWVTALEREREERAAGRGMAGRLLILRRCLPLIPSPEGAEELSFLDARFQGIFIGEG